jgi:aspartyl/asparaginyl-tRNA synthetase
MTGELNVIAATCEAETLPQYAAKIFIRDLSNYIGGRAVFEGWLVSTRRTQSLCFLVLRDRSGEVQAVCRSEMEIRKVANLTRESAIRIYGTVREAKAGRFGKAEIEVETIDILAAAETPLPLDGNSSADARLEYRYLDLRSRAKFLIFEVQTTLEAAVRAFLLERAFVEIHSPKITSGGSESGAAVFELPYFGRPACLIQSPQFYMQLAMAAGFDRAFEIGPVFRAEAAITNRHATEFTCIDVELSWIDSTEQLMTLEEELLRHVLMVIRREHGQEIERRLGAPVEVPETPIPRLPLSDALALSEGVTAQSSSKLTHRAEQALCKYARDRCGHSFVFVTNYPAADRPFYTMHQEQSGSTTQTLGSRSFDLLWRGMEITSGCQREHRYDRLKRQAMQAGLESATLCRYLEAYYFEMFRYGCPPHGGFGIGLDRLLMAILAQPSIRETSFVYRGPERYVP